MVGIKSPTPRIYSNNSLLSRFLKPTYLYLWWEGRIILSLFNVLWFSLHFSQKKGNTSFLCNFF